MVHWPTQPPSHQQFSRYLDSATALSRDYVWIMIMMSIVSFMKTRLWFDNLDHNLLVITEMRHEYKMENNETCLHGGKRMVKINEQNEWERFVTWSTNHGRPQKWFIGWKTKKWKYINTEMSRDRYIQLNNELMRETEKQGRNGGRQNFNKSRTWTEDGGQI